MQKVHEQDIYRLTCCFNAVAAESRVEGEVQQFSRINQVAARESRYTHTVCWALFYIYIKTSRASSYIYTALESAKRRRESYQKWVYIYTFIIIFRSSRKLPFVAQAPE